MAKQTLHRNNRGDTIVEVLIALVIVSTVITGAFAISNLSLRQVRMAQERTEGQKTAQSAAESLNSLYEAKPEIKDVEEERPAFCKTSGVNDFTVTTEYISEDETTTCRSGADNRYHTAIQPAKAFNIEDPDVDELLFRITVTWPSLSGRDEQVELYYRVREPET